MRSCQCGFWSKWMCACLCRGHWVTLAMVAQYEHVKSELLTQVTLRYMSTQHLGWKHASLIISNFKPSSTAANLSLNLVTTGQGQTDSVLQTKLDLPHIISTKLSDGTIWIEDIDIGHGWNHFPIYLTIPTVHTHCTPCFLIIFSVTHRDLPSKIEVFSFSSSADTLCYCLCNISHTKKDAVKFPRRLW